MLGFAEFRPGLHCIHLAIDSILNRRQFLSSLLALGMTPEIIAGFSLPTTDFYTLPDFGGVTLLHFTDSHGQLLPMYYREPSTRAGGQLGCVLELQGQGRAQSLLDYSGIKPNSREAHAFTSLNFTESALVFGKMGGFAHLAALIKRIRQARGPENVLLLDGGDSWQGSATALWTQGQDMIAAANLLAVDAMTGHWEFTHGSGQVLKNLKQFNGEFVAQNVALSDEAQFALEVDNQSVFKPYIIKAFKHANVAVIGQAFPYTPVAHPQRLTPDWRFGIQEQNLQSIISEIKTAKQADVIVLLSHNGLDVDLKLASRVSGLDIILGGHTHDVLPKPILVQNPNGKTWVTNAGSHGKFLAVLDLDIAKGRLRELRYRLMPVFANLLAPDADMQALINTLRAPYLNRLQQPLAVTDQLLYRRDTYLGTFDQVLLNALQSVHDAQIALSPGFRWGTTLLPGHTIRYEDVMNHTAISYPETYVRNLTGEQIKTLLEDVADNLFNPDPYYRQGGDMIRVGGMRFHCNLEAALGQRISQMRLTNGRLIAASKRYKVAGWASVGDVSVGQPIDEVVTQYLKAHATR